MTSPAPVALFVYNRPAITGQTIDALRQNEDADRTDLTVFSDGWKDERDRSAVEQVRAMIAGITGFRSVTVVARERNLGLSRSVVTGVSTMLDRHDRVIVLEDDLVTSPYFLRYMNDGLRTYANDLSVVSVHGYVYPVTQRLPETFFLRGADCWGWATWKRGWSTLRLDAAELLRELQNAGQDREFDLDGGYPFTRMLRRQADGTIDSWAVCWHAGSFLAGRLTLFPGRSLVRHTGTGITATHAWSLSDRFDGPLSDSPIVVERIPIAEDSSARAAFRAFLRTSRGNVLTRAVRALRRRLR